MFPYDYLNSPDKLNYKGLPPKEAFFNKLTQTHVTDEDYDYAQTIFREFDLETFGDYVSLYCKSDVLLLGCVFEQFRRLTLEHFRLDPAYYPTLPALSWDAMLRYTNVTLDLLTDIDMYLFFEQSVRGGITTVPRKYSKANNPLLPDYNPTEDEKYILY